MSTTPTPALNQILQRLTKVTKTTTGYSACCPAHDDHRPSLSIAQGTDGKILLRCFAGCNLQDILRHLGLTLKDLFPADQGRLSQRKEYEEQVHTAAAPVDPEDAVLRTHPSAMFIYRDEAGSPLYEIRRWDTSDGKSFRCFHYDECGLSLPGMGNVRRVPFRLPELIAGIQERRRVFITEGEKNASDLSKIGVVATTSPHGGAAWPACAEFSSHFAGANVIILPDRDETGRKYARSVAGSLQGIVGSVRILNLPGLKHKEDVSDWIAKGGTLADLELLSSQSRVATRQGTRGKKKHLLPASEIEPEHVDWLWKGYIPRGKLIILDGDPSTGKSTMTADLAARLTRAVHLPDGQQPTAPMDVLFLSCEDGEADTVVPRLQAAGADNDRIHFLRFTESGNPIGFPGDIETLRTAIASTGAEFVIVDPLMSHLSDGVDAHKDQSIRKALQPLVALAEEYGCAILLIRHPAKHGGGGKAIHAGGGSIGIIGIARVGLVAAKDPDHPGQFILAVAKSNLAGMASSLSYRIESDEANQCGRIEWLGSSSQSADDLMQTFEKLDSSTMTDACNVLEDVLQGGPMKIAAAKAECLKAGISPTAIDKARIRLEVISRKEGQPGTSSSGWYWLLPSSDLANAVREKSEDQSLPISTPDSQSLPFI